MPHGLHKHNFGGETTLNNRHTHRYCNITSLDPNFWGHVHYMIGTTTVDDGHMHQYFLETGPSMPDDGNHVHYYRAATSFEHGHIHCMWDYTN